MKHRAFKSFADNLQLVTQVFSRRECFDMSSVPLAAKRGLLPDQQSHFVSARTKIGCQFRSQSAGGKVCQPSNTIQRLISWSGSNNTLHRQEITDRDLGREELLGLDPPEGVIKIE